MNQVFTPPWLEHAPRCCFAKLYVPSLHCAVAFAASAGGVAVVRVVVAGAFAVRARGLDVRGAAGAAGAAVGAELADDERSAAVDLFGALEVLR